jgi:hypothetical protein
MKCPNCGIENIDESSFCNSCGSSMNPFKKKENKIIDFNNKKRLLVIIGVIIIVLLLVIVAYYALFPQTNQVKITVTCSGDWVCAYGDQTGIETFSGSGIKSVILNRPSNVDDWTVIANAMSLYGDYLTVTISDLDGTVLAKKSGSFGMVLVTAKI